MEELREEVGVRGSLTRKLVRESLTTKLVRSRLKWAGHVERMEGEWLRKRADVLRVEGRRRRGRLRLCEEKFGGSERGVENESEGWGSGE